MKDIGLASNMEEIEEIREKEFTNDEHLMWVQQVSDKRWLDKSEPDPCSSTEEPLWDLCHQATAVPG